MTMMMVRIREELDTISNIKKEDLIIITGLTNSIPTPRREDDNKI